MSSLNRYFIFEKKEMRNLEDKSLDNNLTLKRKRIMIYFIEAAEKLIRQNGIENLSIRKIATEAGYNSATIYNYFNDLEQLTMFASICYLREYVSQLEKELKPEMRAIDSYRTIYHCFNRNALRYPEIYHNIFFGKYSGELASVLHLYYHELFPNELENFSEETRTMLVQGSMVERDRATMERMVQEGDIQADKAEITLDLIVALHQNFLYEASLGGENFDAKAHEEKFNRMFEYLLAAGK